jgi:7,8-dihydroneopterin aldolase/epimerase/oxygenase
MVIELKDLRFHSKHGLYEEETATGGEFLLNVNVHFKSEHLPALSLNDTINYVDIYKLIADKMNVAEALLEKLAFRIGEEILKFDDKIFAVDIELFKLHPPIIQFNGKVGVKLTVKK